MSSVLNQPSPAPAPSTQTTIQNVADLGIRSERRTVDVYDSPDATPRNLTEADTLDGGEVLPGFSVPLRELFAELDQMET